MNNHHFHNFLQQAETRIAPTRSSVRMHLDKNEQSEDIDLTLKKRVLDSLLHADWNRYPASDYKEIEEKIAEYCGLAANQIVLSAGSASIITTLLDFFALNKKDIIINQPSYGLFDYHCKTYNIPYQPWFLNTDLEFDLNECPTLSSNSVVIITSPNNPVGNTVSYDVMRNLLQQNPEALFIIDGVYAEFSSTNFTPLINEFENLIILRSFSKAFPVAGLRLGYLCASPNMASIIKKLILQFSITHFSLIFAKEMLFDPAFVQCSKLRIASIVEERERLFETIQNDFDETQLKVFKSEGNFLLMRVDDQKEFDDLMNCFTQNGIKILNTSNFPMLKNTFRVSIGSRHENETFMNCLYANISAGIDSMKLMAV